MDPHLANSISESGIKFEEADDFLTQSNLVRGEVGGEVGKDDLFRSHPFRETIFSSAENIHTTISELKFRANFECANLQKVDRVHFTSCRADKSVHYALWMHPDPSVQTPLRVSIASTQWFYFHVSGMLPNVSYRMHIVNFCKSNCVLINGMRPVIRDTDASCNDASTGKDNESIKRNAWRRFGSDITYRPSHELGILSDDEAHGAFTFSFTLTLPHEGSIFVALTHPYSYLDLQHSLGLLKSVNVRRDTLCLSPQGRRVDIVVATENGKEYFDEHFESDAEIRREKGKVSLHMIEECNADGDKADFELKDGVQRRYKPVLFFCARAVGSDAPASFAAEGIITWLASSDSIVRTLLQHFVIIIVPLLNPDGCSLGHARADAGGTDLSQSWRRPDRIREPSVYFCKRYLRKLGLEGRLAACVEIKAHSRQIGSFFYGVRSRIDRAAVTSAFHRNKGVDLPNQGTTNPRIVPTLPAQFTNPPHWDFLLAYMRRSPFLMDHRACSFETLDLLSPPDSSECDTPSDVNRQEMAPLSLRQALHRLQGCPSLAFTHYLSIFRGNKGPLEKRHLHPEDYRRSGRALLLALAESLGVVLHRSNRESYIALSTHDTVGAGCTDIDRDFAVLERALRMGKGGLSGRHESFHIAQAVQVRNGSKTRIDDDFCCDLNAWETLSGKHREYLRTLGWSESLTIDASDSPMSSDDEKFTASKSIAFPGNISVVGNGSKSVSRMFCFHCKVFGHEWGAQCVHYFPPAAPKKRIDEEYAITDDFYRKVVKRYLNQNPPNAMDDVTTKKSNSMGYNGFSDDKSAKFSTKLPKFETLISENEVLWLASHFPEAGHIGGMRSRKLEDQANRIAIQYRDFKLSTCEVNNLSTSEDSCDAAHIFSNCVEQAKDTDAASVLCSRSEMLIDVNEALLYKAPKPPRSEPPSLRSARLKGDIPRFIAREAASLSRKTIERPCVVVPNSARRKVKMLHEKNVNSGC
jgi:hypothetical protein